MGRDLLVLTQHVPLQDSLVAAGHLELRLVQPTDHQSQLKVLHLLYTDLPSESNPNTDSEKSISSLRLSFPSREITTISFQQIVTEEEYKQVYLNSIFQGSSQQKESRRMLETLLSEQRERVL